jgi:uncharacterized protein (TIGR03083 family)
MREQWGWLSFDLEGAKESLREVCADLAILVESVDRPDTRARGLSWTVLETAAHVVVVARANAAYATGQDEPVLALDNLASSNRERIDEVETRSPGELAEALRDAIAAYLAAIAGLDAFAAQNCHGVRVPLGGALGIVLGELLVHGEDIARGLGKPWTISAARARFVTDAMPTFAPAVVDADRARAAPASFDIRVRGANRSVWRFADGALEVGPADGRPVDCHISADPRAFLLVAYGRRSQVVEVLRGRLVAYGRRPWKALQFRSYVRET